MDYIKDDETSLLNEDGSKDPLKFIKEEAEKVAEEAKAIDKADGDDEQEIKKRIVPLLLSSYDPHSLGEIKEIQKKLKKEGYIHARLIDDLETKTNFDGKNDIKFLRYLNLHMESEFFMVPIFYFCPPNREDQGVGHHSELVDLIMVFSELVFVTGIFHYKDAKMLNQVRLIPSHNHFEVKDFKDHFNQVKKFVDAFFPFVERRLLCEKKQKNFYTLKNSFSLRGDNNG